MEPILAFIYIFGFNFPPRGYAQCDGHILSINQNQALFSLLGTTYGGDGRTTFGLPDLRGRIAIHKGSGAGLSSYSLGQKGGAETHTLTTTEMPAHGHTIPANGTQNDKLTATPSATTFFGFSEVAQYNSTTNATTSSIVTAAGGGQAHENMMPSLAINYCIALTGLFPSRN